MTKVFVLGATGMLGSMVARYLSENEALDVVATYRGDLERFDELQAWLPSVHWYGYDVKSCFLDIAPDDWIINCIGVSNPHVNGSCSTIVNAINVNALYPHLLASSHHNKIIQIASDCVYSGQSNNPYFENSPHDALDVHGKSKSLGEQHNCNNVSILRCGIVGDQLHGGEKSLLEWFRGQDKNVEIDGYTNHFWNGITTLHFAKICEAMILNNIILNHSVHIVPRDTVSKFELLYSFATHFRRHDLVIKEFEATQRINRVLQSNFQDIVDKFWTLAGYEIAPSIEQMVSELAAYIK